MSASPASRKRKSLNHENGVASKFQIVADAYRVKEQGGIRRGDPLHGIDVLVSLLDAAYGVQCKHHDKKFPAMYALLDLCEIAVVKENYKKDVAVLYLDTLIEIIRLALGGKKC